MKLGSLIIVFLIIMLLFGTKRLRNIGDDLSAAVKSFRKGLHEEEDNRK